MWCQGNVNIMESFYHKIQTLLHFFGENSTNEHNTYQASRVTILDSKLLDVEVYDIIKNQLNVVISHLPPGALSSYEPEINLLLRLFLWQVSVGRTGATFGQQLLSLRYDSASPKVKLFLHAVLIIGGSYFKERQRDLLYLVRFTKSEGILQNTTDYLETSIKIMNILAFMFFLKNGEAPTFLERFMGLTPVSLIKSTARNIGYAFITRELIWHGFIEMVMFMIPFINYHAVKRRLRRLVGIKERTWCPDGSRDSSSVCPVCHLPPVIPHHMGCPHVFCYYCLAANLLADNLFECPICGFSKPNGQPEAVTAK